MATTIEQFCSTARQQSGKDTSGQDILSVLVKRTYHLDGRGDCALADEQLPLCEEPETAPDDDDLLVEDTDLWPFKPSTDIIVKGCAYSYNGQRQFYASVRVADATKQILVQGDRRCTLTSIGGKLLFSRPDPIERVPLSYIYAYGGRDEVAEAVVEEKYAKRPPYIDPDLVPVGAGSSLRYPRNPCGRGYVLKISAQSIEKLLLPNLEDPVDPLTAERLEVGNGLLWPRMPLPQATGWVGYTWFPRIAGAGIIPPFQCTGEPFTEAKRGYFPENVVSPAHDDLVDPFQDDLVDPFHLTCGASLGLQLPYLQGGEPVVLQNIHPTQPNFSFHLPKERPRLWTDGRKGKLNETQPVIHTVVIEPDESRLSIVWRGSAQALRPYMDYELEKMPFRVEW